MKISIDIKSGEIAKKEEPKEIIVGIDLGTTHSLVAYIREGEPHTIKTPDGIHTLLPSILHLTEDGQWITGEPARKYLLSDPESTIYSVKRLMGKSYEDIKAFEHIIGYKISHEEGRELVRIKIRDRYFTPIEVSAEILKKLKKIAEKELNAQISKAVITVPAYFNDAQRQATRDAGKLAGLDVLRIVNEPTAASLAYGLGLKRDEVQNIAVYDLGGGTFDISILHLEDGIFDVLSTHGDTFLGGDDFDKCIIDYWSTVYNFSEQSLKEDPALGQGIRLLAEQAKKQLSENEYFSHTIADRVFSIDRNTFESLISPLVEKTIQMCRLALKDAGLKCEEIDHVVLVGGSTRVPLVKKEIQKFFGKEAYDKVNPDEVVALGAAIQADILAGNRSDLLLLDITPLSLGIETLGGLMDIIIPRNTKVPAGAGRQYTTSVDGQTKLRISVYQGERDLVRYNRKLGEFILKGIPPMPAGIPKIEVRFITDADGILTVKAKELRSGTEAQIEIKSTYGISEEEMAAMLLDSIHHAGEDRDAKALQEAVNEGQYILASSKKFIIQNSEILDAGDLYQISNLSEKLDDALLSGDKDKINLAIENLNQFTAPLAHKVMDIRIKEALSGKTV